MEAAAGPLSSCFKKKLRGNAFRKSNNLITHGWSSCSKCIRSMKCI